jgi:hypothetical protein
MGRDIPVAAIGTGNDDVSQKSLVAAQQTSGDEGAGNSITSEIYGSASL